MTITSAEEPWRALYRRFRPQRFSEIRGQDHVTTALRNGVRLSKVAHAYLFSGPRGTGKTSAARILAKALNCTAPEDGEPCGSCESCLAITRGASFDVHELDAASNNGVDAMRELVARASLSTPGREKVYIVDEVHMLSTAASNALLKTLEEPPAHVVFVLATTDPQKVLPTIRSRTQHFEFRLLPPDTLTALLSDVAAAAELGLSTESIASAVRRGRGSARDALSVLDQVAAGGGTLGEGPGVGEIVTAIVERDTPKVLAGVAEALAGGYDVHRLAVELVESLRRGFLLLAAPEVAAKLDASLGAPDASLEQVRELGVPRCVRAIEIIGTTQVGMRTAADPRITLEVALARLTHPEADDSSAALLERIERLERQSRRPDVSAPDGRAPADREEADANPRGSTEVRRVRRPRDEPEPEPEPEQQARADRTIERPSLGAFAGRPGAERSGERGTPPTGRGATKAEQMSPERGAAEGGTPARPETGSVAAPADGGQMPARDDLVEAWGDRVLATLRPRARAVFQAGRFVGVEGREAIFALPNKAHVGHAQPLVSEIVSALSTHFRCDVRLRLVVDEPGLGSAGGDAPSEDHYEDHSEDMSEMEDAAREPDARRAQRRDRHDERPAEDQGVSWATDRLLEAFPGAEEV